MDVVSRYVSIDPTVMKQTKAGRHLAVGLDWVVCRFEFVYNIPS